LVAVFGSAIARIVRFVNMVSPEYELDASMVLR
jgi:hypothetical protein